MPLVLATLALVFSPAQIALDRSIAAVLPTQQEEKWRMIPWRLNLMAARLEAQRDGKPLFLWIMNGHPMGCT